MSDTTCQRRADRLDWALAVCWTVLAAAPRLLYLDLAEFKLDEATHYQMAYNLLRGAWRWVGSTASVGLPKPALLVYVLALPMQWTRDPRVITAFLGLLADADLVDVLRSVSRGVGSGLSTGCGLVANRAESGWSKCNGSGPNQSPASLGRR